MSKRAYIYAAVEGVTDEAIIRVVTLHEDFEVVAVYGKDGKDDLRRKLSAYNHAARYKPWIVLTDLDNDASCAPPLRMKLLPMPARKMCFRIAVPEVESWLLADRERLAAFLGVSIAKIPVKPESQPDPKQIIVQLARKSSRRAIQEDMVPREGSGRSTGPAYASRLIEFIQNKPNGWRCSVARKHSESLDRCLKCLKRLRKLI